MVLRSWGSLTAPISPPSKTLEVEDSEKKQKVVPNPAYSAWHVSDQHVLGFLLKSLSPDVISEVLDLEHASEVWQAITTLYSSQSKARITMLHGALSNTKKNELSIVQYITKMKGFASELSAAGKKVDDDAMKDYILNGLDGDYNPIVASINSVPRDRKSVV